jgi:hypothetical protein
MMAPLDLRVPVKSPAPCSCLPKSRHATKFDNVHKLGNDTHAKILLAVSDPQALAACC